MKNAVFFTVLFLIFSCKKTEKEKYIGFIHENYFSVSEIERKLDSIVKATANDSVHVIIDNNVNSAFYNKNYLLGSIHFLIEDSVKSYYAIRDLEPFILMCGNVPPFSKVDSLQMVENNKELVKKLKPISTKSIQKILRSNKNSIVENTSNRPLLISFAIKNDTLKGETMFKIASFMEANEMYRYEIRRMNKEELQFLGY